MRRFITFSLLALAALLTAAPPADAQQRRRVIAQDDGVPIIRVRPRSFLDPGNVVQPGSLNRARAASGSCNRICSPRPMSASSSATARAGCRIR